MGSSEIAKADPLSPKERLAVRLYMSPMRPDCFGNKQASAQAAGFGDRMGKIFKRGRVQAAINEINEQRDEQAKDVFRVVSRFTPEALMGLVGQLGVGQDLEIVDPREILAKDPIPIVSTTTDADGNTTEVITGYDVGHYKQAAAITAHNKSVAALMDQRRRTALVFLNYHLGIPQQRAAVERANKASETALGDLSTDEIRSMYTQLRDEISKRKGGTAGIDGAPEGRSKQEHPSD